MRLLGSALSRAVGTGHGIGDATVTVPPRAITALQSAVLALRALDLQKLKAFFAVECDLCDLLSVEGCLSAQHKNKTFTVCNGGSIFFLKIFFFKKKNFSIVFQLLLLVPPQQ